MQKMPVVMKLEHCKRVTVAAVHHLKQQIHASFHTSKSPLSSSLTKPSYLHPRKWPIRSYEEESQRFAFELAMKSFKQSINKSNPTNLNLLSTLINSFSTYEIDPTPEAYRFLFKFLIQNHSFHHQIPQTLDHLEKVENFEIPECIFVDLIKFYGNGSMFSEAVELFFRIPKFRCEVTAKSLNALLLVLCRDEIGIKLVPEILGKSIIVDESSFRILIKALCRMGKVNAAMQLLWCMAEDGLFTADQKLMSLVLAVKCRDSNGSEGEIKGFLRDLRKLGFEPREDDFCNVIRFLVGQGKGLSALKVLREMKADRISPDLTCYNLVLDGLFREREFSKADQLFDEILVLGLVPDVHTYNVYVWGLCRRNKVDEGIDMLACMEELGCMPNLNTYISILSALCESREMERVRELMYAMRQRLIKMNSAAYGIMLDRLVIRGDIDVARGLMNEMFENKFVPTPTALNKVICCYCNNGSYFEAVELLNGVIVYGIAPGAKTWEALIQECQKSQTRKDNVLISQPVESKDRHYPEEYFASKQCPGMFFTKITHLILPVEFCSQKKTCSVQEIQSTYKKHPVLARGHGDEDIVAYHVD